MGWEVGTVHSGAAGLSAEKMEKKNRRRGDNHTVFRERGKGKEIPRELC